MAQRANTVRRVRGSYVQGNTVRKEDLIREMNKPYKPVDARVARNRAKAKRMSPGYVLFLAAAVIIACLTLTSYIKMQAELTVSIDRKSVV